MSDKIFSYSQARELAYQALDYRSLRQDLISSNIANVDTPMYRPKDVSFEQMLAQKSQELFGEPSLELTLGETHATHIQPQDTSREMGTFFFRDGHLARNDGNSVDLDVETSELGKNGVMYQAVVASLKKHGGIFSYAIESGKSL